jgi:hypothetical protein
VGSKRFLTFPEALRAWSDLPTTWPPFQYDIEAFGEALRLAKPAAAAGEPFS